MEEILEYTIQQMRHEDKLAMRQVYLDGFHQTIITLGAKSIR